MEVEPYSIYVDHRPARIAFLIPRGDPSALDSAVAFSRRKWGGRFYPIVPVTDGTITDDWWSFLRAFDADLMLSAGPLADPLRRRIHTFLSPLKVEVVLSGRDDFHLSEEPVGVLPSDDVIKSVAGTWIHEQVPLASFNMPDSTPEPIKQFIRRNFGFIDQARLVIHEMVALKSVRLRNFEVFDESSLNAALLQLGDYGRLVFPSQLCAQPSAVPDVEYRVGGGGFGVIIGESFDDILYHWNRSITMPLWLRAALCQLWLPLELANSSTLRPGLTKFVSRYVDTTGNDHEKAARFTSFSVDKTVLERIATDLGGRKKFRADTAKLLAHPLPSFRSVVRPRGIRAGQGAWQARSSEEHLSVGEPDAIVSPMQSEYWIAEVTMEYVRRASTGSVHRELWWQLPQRNSVLHEIRMFNKPARVQAGGTFAVFMTREGVARARASDLVVRLPSDAQVMRALICGPRFDHYEAEWAARERSAPYHRIEWSDKGQYLTGVLSLFPDLYNAYVWFESRLWRRLFARMANAAERGDELARQKAGKRLKRVLDKPMNMDDPKTLDYLADKVLMTARESARREAELCFEDFKTAAQAELDEFNQSSQGGPFSFESEELKSRLSTLMDWRVLLAGFKPRCPRCGYRTWHQVDAIAQQLVCTGCSFSFSLQAEERWFYRLNSLVRAGVAEHGTVPLLLALGQLMVRAQSSFLFTPCVNLIQRGTLPAEDRVVGDLDIVCIVDGKLVIGEVKESVGKFGKEHFAKMAEIGRAIRPDRIIFTSMDTEPSPLVRAELPTLQAELQPFEIDVAWYPLDTRVLTASPTL